MRTGRGARRGIVMLATGATLAAGSAALVSMTPSIAGQGIGAEPTEAMLGVPLYPSADFLDVYDAGRGQTFYLFGTNSSFEDMVRYYRVRLDERGDRVFDAPATHQFDTGRFDDDRMDYRPSVTIKDYAWNGSPGYLNPAPDADPPRYRTIIQIVTAPVESRDNERR